MVHLRHFLPLQMLLVAAFSRLQAVAEHIHQSINLNESARPTERPVRAIPAEVAVRAGAGMIQKIPAENHPAPLPVTKSSDKSRSRKNAIDDIFG